MNYKKDIKKDLDNLNVYFNKLNEDNNIKEYIKSNSIVDKKEQYIDNYIYNSIVNHSLYKYEHIEMIVKNKKSDNITLDDLIQEVAYQNKIKSEMKDKQRKKFILLLSFMILQD
mgnify:CR=1 FL=1